MDENKTECLVNILKTFTDLFGDAIKAAFPDLQDAPIVIAVAGNKPNFGDYQCNSALPISKILKQNGMY